MAYIGKQPLVGNFIKLDAITASATDTYNLLNDSVAYTPQSAMNCIVSLNGVIQAPITAYTIVGTTIVFSETLSASDTIDFILVLGDVLDVGTVSDDTISTAKIKDLNVTAGKLAATQDLSTKTITLPASVSGLGTGITNAQLAGSITDAKITGLSSSKLSGVVPTANLGSGTASSSTILYGDQTYKAEPTTDLTPLRQDIITLALKQGVQENMTKHNLPSSAVVTFQADADYNSGGSTDITRNASKYISTVAAPGPFGGNDSYTQLLIHGDGSDASTTITDSS